MRRLVAILLAGLVLAPLASAAARAPVFGLRALGNPKRGYFVYSLAPTGRRTGAVIVSNTGTAAGTVKLFAADATTGRTSGTVYLTDQKPVRAGAWIALDESQLSLAPGAHRQVGFTVHVPSGVQAGQWVGGIVAETTHQVAGPKSSQKANVQIRIRDLTIVAVQVNVPGTPVIAVKVGAVKTGGQRGFQQVIAYLENDSNTLIKPTGSVTVLDSSGRRIETLTFAMDTFLPHTAIEYPVLLKKALAPGNYSAIVRVNVPGLTGAKGTRVNVTRPLVVSKQDVKQVFTSAAPQAPPPGLVASSSSGPKRSWPLIGLIAGVVLLLLVALLWWIFRRGATMAPPAAPAAVEARTAPPPASPAPVSEPGLPPPMPDVAPPVPEPVAPAPPPPPPASGHEHLWEVAYERGELGSDGAWRFPHRCRTCGKELLARDVADASARADG